MIAPIILAAGASTRMGSPKALLDDGSGRAFVTRLLHTFADAGFSAATVVTGAAHQPIVAAVARDVPRGMSVTFARNPDPSRGQLSSLLTGMESAIRPGVTAILVTLVDVPFVSAETVRAIARAHADTTAPIVRPARGTEHGHPVLFGKELFAPLRTADLHQGAKPVVRAHARRIVDVAVDDAGAFRDVDTREDYERMLST